MAKANILIHFFDHLLLNASIIEAMRREGHGPAEALRNAVANHKLYLDPKLIVAAAFVEAEFLASSRPVKKRHNAQRMGRKVVVTIMSFDQVFWIWAPRNEVVGYFASVEDAISHMEGLW